LIEGVLYVALVVPVAKVHDLCDQALRPRNGNLGWLPPDVVSELGKQIPLVIFQIHGANSTAQLSGVMVWTDVKTAVQTLGSQWMLSARAVMRSVDRFSCEHDHASPDSVVIVTSCGR